MSRKRSAMSAFAAAVGVVLIISGMIIVGYFILIAIALSRSGGGGK